MTAGYIHDAARREFFAAMDAANVDLKGFTEDFYRKLCFAHLEPVKETLVYLAKETDVWLEVTTLLIPGPTIPTTRSRASATGSSAPSATRCRSTSPPSTPTSS